MKPNIKKDSRRISYVYVRISGGKRKSQHRVEERWKVTLRGMKDDRKTDLAYLGIS